MFISYCKHFVQKHRFNVQNARAVHVISNLHYRVFNKFEYNFLSLCSFVPYALSVTVLMSVLAPCIHKLWHKVSACCHLLFVDKAR